MLSSSLTGSMLGSLRYKYNKPPRYFTQKTLQEGKKHPTTISLPYITIYIYLQVAYQSTTQFTSSTLQHCYITTKGLVRSFSDNTHFMQQTLQRGKILKLCMA